MKKKIISIALLSVFAFGATNEELTIAVAKLIKAQNNLKQKVTVINKKYTTVKYNMTKADKKMLLKSYKTSKLNSQKIKKLLKDLKNNKKNKTNDESQKVAQLQEDLLTLKSNFEKFSENITMVMQNTSNNSTNEKNGYCNNSDTPILDEKLLAYLKEK